MSRVIQNYVTHVLSLPEPRTGNNSSAEYDSLPKVIQLTRPAPIEGTGDAKE